LEGPLSVWQQPAYRSLLYGPRHFSCKLSYACRGSWVSYESDLFSVERLRLDILWRGTIPWLLEGTGSMQTLKRAAIFCYHVLMFMCHKRDTMPDEGNARLVLDICGQARAKAEPV
jgi:hypothetical protein